MNDLYLKYKFTDRGGKHVFDVYELEEGDRIHVENGCNLVGEVRMEPDWADAVTMEERGEPANEPDNDGSTPEPTQEENGDA